MIKNGYVYVLVNPAFPHLVKIGYSERSGRLRAIELSNLSKTSLPTNYSLAYERQVNDCSLVEKLVHIELRKYKYNHKREFFQVSVEEAKATIEKIIEQKKLQLELPIDHSLNQELSPLVWWDSLDYTWQLILRSQIKIVYEPDEIDLLKAIYNVIRYCSNERLRIKVAELIVDKNFFVVSLAWYKSLGNLKEVLNPFLPFDMTDSYIDQIFNLTKIEYNSFFTIYNLKPLKMLKNLQEVNVMSTFISDLEPLSYLSDLEKLNINYTKVTDLSPLEKLPNLKYLECIGTNIPEKEIERFKAIHRCKVVTISFLR